MIYFERKDYGTFLMVNFPWMDHCKGVGLGAPDLEEMDYVREK